jgi:hypothetical protein
MVITIKELSLIIGRSEKTARKKANEIKEKYGIQYLTTFHVAEFYHLKLSQVLILQTILSEHNESKRSEALESLERIECPRKHVF